MSKGRLSGIRAIVTGGSKGLGRCVAGQLIGDGARVAVLARPSLDLDSLASELGGDLIALPCDLRNGADITGAVGDAALALGGLDLLINNAGICLPGSLDGLDEQAIAAQIETNLLAPIRVTKEAIPHLRASGRGHIINISSEAGDDPRPLLSVYSATKAAIEAFSTALKYELRDDQIRVTIFRAGKMNTGTIQSAWSPEARAALFAACERTGHLWRAGEGMAPEGPAKAIADIAATPADASIDLVEMRSR